MINLRPGSTAHRVFTTLKQSCSAANPYDSGSVFDSMLLDKCGLEATVAIFTKVHRVRTRKLANGQIKRTDTWMRYEIQELSKHSIDAALEYLYVNGMINSNKEMTTDSINPKTGRASKFLYWPREDI
jgi:hypothetical protein